MVLANGLKWQRPAKPVSHKKRRPRRQAASNRLPVGRLLKAVICRVILGNDVIDRDHQFINPVRNRLRPAQQLLQGPIRRIAFRHIFRAGMVDKALGQAGCQTDLAFGDRDEVIAQGMKPEPCLRFGFDDMQASKTSPRPGTARFSWRVFDGSCTPCRFPEDFLRLLTCFGDGDFAVTADGHAPVRCLRCCSA